MKTSIVFPMFWGREKTCTHKKGDYYYDHPTAIDSEGTIPPLFESMKNLEDQDFDVVAVAGNGAEGYKEKTETALNNLMAKYKKDFKIYTVCYSQLEKLHAFFKEKGKEHLLGTLSLTGYSPLRNMCFVAANILNSDIAVSIDDDIIFTKPDYVSMIKNTIKTKFQDKEILALCGPYITAEDKILLPVKISAVTAFYDTIIQMNKLFQEKVIEGERLKEVHFSIMGNIAVHKDFYMKIPLDPPLQRGEDSDWVMNANIFGHSFILDNTLMVKHVPLKRPHPAWMPMREDIKRFVHIKNKIANSRDSDKTHKLEVSNYDPFPGCFFRDNLMDKMAKACLAMSQEYLIAGETENAREALQNIYIAKYAADPGYDAFKAYVDFQAKWEEMMLVVGENRTALKKLLFD
ncbi:hypothetical protein KKF70_03230 [bacterium]|nr:hypothetical protein [Candidatus Omnitrophota bacterium]MBU2528382.1 hypothetical protein [bacterium]MBU3930640.1 hypothetical protein [bacterium]MBU4123403.1 hypothetical protein [bacterium]